MAASLEKALAETQKNIYIFNRSTLFASSLVKLNFIIQVNCSNLEHTNELFKSSKILNVSVFTHKTQGKSTPNIFLPKFKKSSHIYPTRFKTI